eukprot:GEMP01000190.1.p1 GENE.GEMP01000190.1~~GEMP01000190.1.p1  ORF type:complete len:2639 (+),score=580.93 GEMP01000190.1:33-7949(+)
MFRELQRARHDDVRKRWASIEATDFAVGSGSWPGAKDSLISSHSTTHGSTITLRPSVTVAGSRESGARLAHVSETEDSGISERLNRMRKRLLHASSTSPRRRFTGLQIADASWDKCGASSSKSPPSASVDDVRASSSKSPPHASVDDARARSSRSPHERIRSRASSDGLTTTVTQAYGGSPQERAMGEGRWSNSFRTRVGEDVPPTRVGLSGVMEAVAGSSGSPTRYTGHTRATPELFGATDGNPNERAASVEQTGPYAAVFSSWMQSIRAEEPESRMRREHATSAPTSPPQYSASPILCPRTFLGSAPRLLLNERGTMASSPSRLPITSQSSPRVESATSVEQLLHKNLQKSHEPAFGRSDGYGALAATRQAEESRWDRPLDQQSGVPKGAKWSCRPNAKGDYGRASEGMQRFRSPHDLTMDPDRSDEETLAKYANAVPSKHQYCSSLFKDQAHERHLQMGDPLVTPERRSKLEGLPAPIFAPEMQVPLHISPSPTSAAPSNAIREKAMHARMDAPSPKNAPVDMHVPQLRSISHIPRAYPIKVKTPDLQRMASNDSVLSAPYVTNVDVGSGSVSDGDVIFLTKDGSMDVPPPKCVQRTPAVHFTASARPRHSSLPPSELLPQPSSFHDLLHGSEKNSQKSDVSNTRPRDYSSSNADHRSASQSFQDMSPDINAHRFAAPNVILSMSEEGHPYPIQVRRRSNNQNRAMLNTTPETVLVRAFRGWMHIICQKNIRSARGVVLWKARNEERQQRRILQRWRNTALVQAQQDVLRSVKLITYQVKQAARKVVRTWKQVAAQRKVELGRSVLLERRVQFRFFRRWHGAFREAYVTHTYHHRLCAAALHQWRRKLRDWHVDAFEKLTIRAAQKMKLIFQMWRAVHFFGVKGKTKALRRMRLSALAALRVNAGFHNATVALLRRRCRRAVRRWHVYSSRNKSITARRIITNVIRGWVSYTVRRQLFRQKWHFHAAPFQVRWTLRYWGTFAKKSVIRKHFTKRGVSFAAQRLEERALQIWHVATLENARLRQLLGRWDRDILLPKLFKLWRIAHHMHKRQQCHLHGALIHNARFLLQRSFTRWAHQVLHVRRKLRELAERGQSRRRFVLLTRAISTWVNAVAMLRAEGRRQMVALEWWQSTVVKRAWYGWRTNFTRWQHRMTQEREIKQKEHKRQMELAKRVMCELRRVLSEKRTRTANLAHVVQLLGHRTRHLAFFAWRHCVRNMKHESFRSAMAEHFLSQWTCLRVVQKWNVRVQAKLVAKEVDRDMHYRIYVLRWRRFLRFWKQMYYARILLGNNGLKRALGAARRWFLYQRRLVYADRAMREVENHRRGKMVKTWHKAYQMQMFRRHIAGVWCCRVLQVWQQYAASNASRRGICLETSVCSRDQAQSQYVFIHWVRYISERQRMCRKKCRDWLLTTALCVWKHKVAREKYLKQTSLTHFNAYCTNLLRKVLLTWQCAACEGEIARHGCFQEIWQVAAQRILEHAFHAWVEETMKSEQIRTIDDLVQRQRGKLLLSRVFCYLHARVVQFRNFRLSLLPGLRRRSWQAWRLWLQREKMFATITHKLMTARRMRTWVMWHQALERAWFLEGVFSMKSRVLDPKRYLYAWRKRVLQKTLSRRLDRILVNRVRECRLRRHVAKWSATHAETRKLRCIDIFAVNRFYFRLAQNTLEVWKCATRTGNIDRVIRHLAMRIRLGAWKAVVFANAWEKLRAQCVFRKWYQRVKHRHMSTHFYHRLLNALLASSWQSWAKIYRTAREKHARLLDLLRCFVGDTEVMLAQRAWQAWYRQREERRRIASCQLEVEKKSLSRRLRQWHVRAHVRPALARMLFLALKTFAAAILSRTFAAWRHRHYTTSNVHHRDTSRVRHLLYSRQRRLLRCWHRIWHMRDVICLFITTTLRAHATKILHNWRRVAATMIRQRLYIAQKCDAETHFLCDGIIRVWRGYIYAIRWIHGMRRLDMRGMHKWFVAWRMDTQSCASVRAKMSRWHAECVRIRNARANAHRCFVLRCVGTQRACLAAMMSYHKQKREVRAHCAECADTLRRRRTLCAVVWWHRDTRLKRLLNKVVCSWGMISTRKLLRAWRAETELHMRLTASAKQLCVTHLVSIVLIAFTAWARWSALARRYSEIARHVFARRYERQRREWFRHWFAGHLLQRQFLKARTVLQVGMWRRVYCAWKDVNLAKHALRDRIEKVRRHLVVRKKRVAVRRWQATWCHNMELKNKIIFYFLRSNRDVAQVVLSGWRSRTDVVRDERKKQKNIFGRICRRTLARRFDAWRKSAVVRRYERRNIARAVPSLKQGAFEAWRFFRYGCVVAKYVHRATIRLQRNILLQWSKQYRTERMGAARMSNALRRPVLRTLGLFMGKLEMVCEWASTLSRVLQRWKHYVRQQIKFRKILRAVDEGRDELLVCKSVQGWQTFTQCKACCRAVFHGWRRMVAAVHLLTRLAALDAKYTQDWWITRFGSHSTVKRILREFHTLYNENNEQDAPRVPVEVVSGLCWQRRQLYLGFTRLRQVVLPEWEEVHAEWPFWELSAPMGSKLHSATLHILDMRMDKFKEFQEQRSLEVLFDYCYQHPDQGDGSQDVPPLASTLCDVILVTLGATRQLHQDTSLLVNSTHRVPKLNMHEVQKANAREGMVVASS